MGHSYGGFVSAVYALRPHNALRKMIIVCGAIDLNDMSSDLLVDEMRHSLSDESQRIMNIPVKSNIDFKRFVEHSLPLYFYDKKYVSEFNLKNKSSYRYSAYCKGELERRKLAHYRKLYSSIDTSTLIIDGKYDFIECPMSSELFRKSAHNCSYCLFEKSGHFPFVEEQALFLRTVTNFLT